MGLLQLGTFIFDTDDLPEKIELGGQQISAIYQYPGGVKDIQVFGTLDDTITLTGTFNYTATDKVTQIDKMYKSGGQYVFNVDGFKSIVVIITKFKPVYRSAYAIDYTIDLEPLSSTYTSTTTASSSGVNSNSSKVVASPPKSNNPAPQRTYIVVHGDTLWGIAKKYYGSGTLYSKITTANKIKNPSLIVPGQKLVIP